MIIRDNIGFFQILIILANISIESKVLHIYRNHCFQNHANDLSSSFPHVIQ